MSRTIYINNTALTSSDVIEWPKQSEVMAFEGSNIIPEDIEFTLNNYDHDYDDRYAASIFYGTSGYGLIVQLWDDDAGRFIFEGKIVQITVDDGSGETRVEAASYLADLSDTSCQYTNYTGVAFTQKTPAAAIYEILTNEAGIPAASIIYSGFQRAINIQTASSVFVEVLSEDAAGETNNNSCADIINELLRVSHCNLYTQNNMVCLKQWETYAGAIGVPVYSHNLPGGEYQHYYATDGDIPIFNSYVVYYDSSGTATKLTGQDATSVTAYGERRFLVPDADMDSTTSTDYRVLMANATGGAWVGTTAIARYKDMRRMCEFTTDDSLEYSHVGDQLDLRFDPFVGEPVMVVERNYDNDAGRIEWKCLFLNSPTEVVERDTTAPDTVYVVNAEQIDFGIRVTWNKSAAADHAGYKVYFSSVPGMWRTEICNKGTSPIDNKSTDTSENGCIHQDLLYLTPNVTYYFKVTDYDSSFNESDDSNTVSCIAPDTTVEHTVTIGDNTGDTYSGCEDAAILSKFMGEPFNTINLGAYAFIAIDNMQCATLIKFSGLSNLPSTASVSSAKLYLYLDPSANTQDFTLTAYGVLRNWTEGTGAYADRSADTPYSCCWNEYGDEDPWTTAGCMGSGTDHDTTAAGTLAIAALAAAGWFAIPIDTDLIESWLSGDRDNYGIVIHTSAIDSIIMGVSSEGADTTRPYFSVTYTL